VRPEYERGENEAFDIDPTPTGLAWAELYGRAQWWDEKVRVFGNPFHRSAYLRAHRLKGERLVGVVDGASGKPVVSGLIAPRRASFRAFSLLQEGAVPAARLVRWLHGDGCRRVELGSFLVGAEGHDKPPGVAQKDRVEFEHDLRLTDQEWWSRLHTNHRRKLRKAEKQGLVLRRISDQPAYALAVLSRDWAKRRGRAYGWRELIRSWWQYRKLLEPLSTDRLGNLYVLSDGEGTLLSGAFMLETDRGAFYMLGASTAAGYRTGASVALFWKLGQQYRETGLSWLNLGGVPKAADAKSHPEHGVYRFKQGFGIAPSLRVSWISEEM